MSRLRHYTLFLLLAAATSISGAAAAEGDKQLSGMSIVGNDDAPKSLVIVPWKSSELGDALDVARVVDDGPGPVDRDVFMRQLDYYEIWAASSASTDAARK